MPTANLPPSWLAGTIDQVTSVLTWVAPLKPCWWPRSPLPVRASPEAHGGVVSWFLPPPGQSTAPCRAGPRGEPTLLPRDSVRFQTFNLIPTLNAQENVETALVPLGVGSSEREARAAQALADVGLGDRARHLPSELSGGQQQRVAIARALVKQPSVVLADEPTGNLDEGTRDEIIGLLEKLWRDCGITLILVTHDSTVAGRAQRIGLMQNGKLEIKQEIAQDANSGAS